MRRAYLFILLSIFICNGAIAQYTPYFQNYSLSEYNAGNQNWGVSKSDEGKLYVANDKGLLEFDGIKWTLFQMPNKTTVRSVLAYDNKVYVGSYEEFGFWKKTNKGELIYESISNLISQTKIINEEFWQIRNFKNAIVFRSFSNIYIYKDGTIKKVKTPSTVISCDVVNDVLYVSTLSDGILVLNNDELVSSIKSDELLNAKVISIIAHKKTV